MESTAYALHAAALSLPLQPGDEVLIADAEFFQVAIPWGQLERDRGIQVKPVVSRTNGVLKFRDFDQAVSARTKVISVSFVQWCSGFRIDMQALGDLCRQRGIWLLVDAVHEMGAMHIDVRSQYADYVFAQEA